MSYVHFVWYVHLVRNSERRGRAPGVTRQTWQQQDSAPGNYDHRHHSAGGRQASHGTAAPGTVDYGGNNVTERKAWAHLWYLGVFSERIAKLGAVFLSPLSLSQRKLDVPEVLLHLVARVGVGLYLKLSHDTFLCRRDLVEFVIIVLTHVKDVLSYSKAEGGGHSKQ